MRNETLSLEMMNPAIAIPTKEIQGESVPVIGMGTWQLTGTECRTAVTTAIELGYRHLDTARAYENEAAIGAAIADSGIVRDELFLTSKVWWEDLDQETVIREIDASLTDLRTDYLDLALVHWPNPDVPLEEPLAALETLKEQDVIRNLGVSNFTPHLLGEALSLAPVFCNQVEYHPLLAQSELLQMARKHDLLMTAYSPLAQGVVEDHAPLQEIGRKHGKTPEQVALRWLIEQPNVVTIPRSSNPEHLAENLEIFDFELDEEDRQLLAALPDDERMIDPDFAPDWAR